MATMRVRSERQELGFDISSLPSIMLDVLEDPALPEVLDLVQQVVDLETSSGGGGGGGASGPGVGLSDAITPLRAYLFVRRHPWVPYAAAFGVVAVPFLIGILVGRAMGK